MLTPHCSAASGMVAPPSIASTTRLRKSSEYGFAIHAGLLAPAGSLNHIRSVMGIPIQPFREPLYADSRNKTRTQSRWDSGPISPVAPSLTPRSFLSSSSDLAIAAVFADSIDSGCVQNPWQQLRGLLALS